MIFDRCILNSLHHVIILALQMFQSKHQNPHQQCIMPTSVPFWGQINHGLTRFEYKDDKIRLNLENSILVERSRFFL